VAECLKIENLFEIILDFFFIFVNFSNFFPLDTDLYVELKQSVLANTSKDDITDLIDYCQDNGKVVKCVFFKAIL